jgi:hypothetical protein
LVVALVAVRAVGHSQEQMVVLAAVRTQVLQAQRVKAQSVKVTTAVSEMALDTLITTQLAVVVALVQLAVMLVRVELEVVVVTGLNPLYLG